MKIKNVARGFGKRCPCFFEALPVVFENDGQCFSAVWATFFQSTGISFLMMATPISRS